MAILSEPARNGTRKSGRPARVMVVDDHPLICRGMEGVLEAEPDLLLVHTTHDLAGARRLIEHDPPDVLLLDLMLGDGDTIEFIGEMRARFPSIPVLVMSMYEEKLHAERVLRAGARGYMEKDEPAACLVEAIRAVLDGRVYLSPAMSDRVMRRVLERESPIEASPLQTLSKREMEVFRMLGNGLRTGEIAEQLKLSIKTVETYRDRIKSKLAMSTTSELVRYAVTWTLASAESR